MLSLFEQMTSLDRFFLVVLVLSLLFRMINPVIKSELLVYYKRKSGLTCKYLNHMANGNTTCGCIQYLADFKKRWNRCTRDKCRGYTIDESYLNDQLKSNTIYKLYLYTTDALTLVSGSILIMRTLVGGVVQ